MKALFEALSHLFLFKPYTDLPRYSEILMGVLAWYCLNIIFYSTIF